MGGKDEDGSFSVCSTRWVAGDGSGTEGTVEKELMFDKVVTPSDVGKLNRLVIPKQHAEKYFPLDSAANEKGLLLCFEDRNGKPWRFRYSYWNSSQSYVMTKGWSRFVKEKRLNAGDTVSFGRGVGEGASDRLYIDWKPRPLVHPNVHPQPILSYARSPPPWAGRLLLPPPMAIPYTATRAMTMSQYLYLRSSPAMGMGMVATPLHGGTPTATATAMATRMGTVPMVLDSVPVTPSQSGGGRKTVRLFGVDLHCPDPMHHHAGEDDDLDPPLQLRLGCPERA